MYTGRLFHCYMLDKSICHSRVVGSILSLSFYFWWKILLANNIDPDQTPHYVASHLGLHCLPIIFLQVSNHRYNCVHDKSFQPLFFLDTVICLNIETSQRLTITCSRLTAE